MKAKSPAQKYLIAIIFGALCFNLAGCGLQPLYGASSPSIGNVKIIPIDGRIGFLTSQELERKFGLNRDGDAKTLKVTIDKIFTNAALGQNSFTSRMIYTASVNYTLSSNGTPIAGHIDASVGFDSKDNAFGEVAYMSDAEDKLSKQIADGIWLDILRQTNQRK